MTYNFTVTPLPDEIAHSICPPLLGRSNEGPAGEEQNSSSSDFDTMNAVNSVAQSDHRKAMHEFSTDELAKRQAQLMTLVAKADRKAFDALYIELSRPLFVIAVDILNDDGEAEDVIQDVFLSI